ncbi:hypothetical protein L873DRAFT_377552 [Choiromyces venosus 120613-1]|uniref:Uncharacterized protein n=1 Tax=Choiromyces venosus 120613-1 TaxID=1336337 RepID=A0A3N4IY52_9PEZI|nr:hypothetical protein L873DRAFT_377552 [Choiromyces venosus 120613-1]
MILPAGTKTTLPKLLIVLVILEPANLLEPLYGLNSRLVLNFPRTGADIERFGGDEINALLIGLGLKVTATVAACKECFKRYIGFITGMD